MIEAKTTPKRKVRDLADAVGVTPAAVYAAVKRGHIPAIRVGAHFRLTEEAFRYHAENGWGDDVAPYGSSEAEAHGVAA